MSDFQIAVTALEDFYRRIHWEAPTAITHSTPGYTLTYSGLNWLHSLNQLWLHSPEAISDEALVIAQEFFGRYQAEYSLVFNVPQPHEMISFWLADRRYAERVSSPIYFLRGLPRPENPNRDVEIVRVSLEQQSTLLETLYSTFFIGPEVGRWMVRPEHADDPTIRHYLAYLDGEVSGCGTLLLDNGIAGVWNVATVRQYRKLGIASALLMNMLVDAAHAGCPDSVLTASPMGRSLYEQMGYQHVGDTHFYSPLE